jgi:hypothetical protein
MIIRALVCAILFLNAESSNAAPFVAPLNYRSMSSQKNTHTCAYKFGVYVHGVLTAADATIPQGEYDSLRTSLAALRKNIESFKRFSADSIRFGDLIDDSFEQIIRLEEEVRKHNYPFVFAYDDLRVAVLVQAMACVSLVAHTKLVTALDALERADAFWKNQQKSPLYYKVTKSPLAWFSFKSLKGEIASKIKQIHLLRTQHHEVLGHITLRASSFDPSQQSAQQLVWIAHMIEQCNQVNSYFFKEVQPQTVEGFAYCIKKIAKQLSRHEKLFGRTMDAVTVPSHWERNWLWYTLGTVAATTAYQYVQKNKSMFSTLLSKVHAVALKNYTNYIAGPLRDIKNEIFTTDGGKPSAGQELIDLGNKIAPSQQEHRDLSQDYVDVCARSRKVLGLNYNGAELLKNAERIDKNYFNKHITEVAREWGKGGLIIESYWNPTQTTTKSKVINMVPELGVVGGRISMYHIQLYASIAIKIAAKRIHETEKKLNLILAMIALVPAYLVARQVALGVKKFGGYFIPQGYDDRSVKAALCLLKDEIDDCCYLHATNDDTFDAQPLIIGRIAYQTSKLMNSLSKVSVSARQTMMHLLEKFYTAPTNTGKRVYLEKMLAEYESWPRFIER